MLPTTRQSNRIRRQFPRAYLPLLKIENKAIQVVDGALDAPLVEGLYEWAVASCKDGWRFGDVADANYSTNPFWGATVLLEERHGTDDPRHIGDTPEIFQRAWTVLERGLGPFKFTIRDIFANGQTYGLDNAIHTDCPKPEEGWYTALVYVNPKWHVDWGGETVFTITAVAILWSL